MKPQQPEVNLNHFTFILNSLNVALENHSV